MAKYFRIAEINAVTFERMTGNELDCLQVALLADDGNVYVAVDGDGQDYIEVDLEMFDADGGNSVDAVVVTRCKDCKHSYEDAFGRACDYGICGDCTVSDDFYCASGKPKAWTNTDNHD